MKIAFITEMDFTGKIPANHPNMRTEFAWMHALNADHHCIYRYDSVADYDHVFVIFPKGVVNLSAEGSKLLNTVNPIRELLNLNVIDNLKHRNNKVYYVQEGPHWWYNDYELSEQISFYNMLASCDGIFAHNQSDMPYYRGLLPTTPTYVMPTLMIESLISDIKPQPENKVIIGGNFARWYGGFESYIVAREFDVPIWGQTSHATRLGEDQLIQQLPRVLWIDWMKQLSTFKYAVHLMPTIAAGTFSLNCAYFGIPCIGNCEVDTQAICHPDLAVDVADVENAMKLAHRLNNDAEFYKHCSIVAKNNYNSKYVLSEYTQHLMSLLNINN